MTEKMTEKTKVIFRKFKDDNSIIALFPEVPGTNNPSTCQSYMHIGQHGSASDNLTGVTVLATPEEYADLKRELENDIGYDLKICKKQSYKMFLTRKNALYDCLINNL